MARPVEPVVRFKPQIDRALAERDFGDEQEPGFFVKTLNPILSKPTPDEVETAPPISKLVPKTLTQTQDMPRDLALKLVKYYADTLNDKTRANPIVDGIPQCTAHRFKSGVSIGCYQACTTGILPRSKDHTLGDVIQWATALIAYNFTQWQTKNPIFKGYLSDVGGIIV